VDAKLGYLICMEGMEAATELQNIQEASQPASFFELPGGLSKIRAPQALDAL